MPPTVPQTSLNPDTHTLTISPSALGAVTTCPARFFYRYIDRVEPRGTDADAVLARNAPAAWGTAFHAAANILHTANLDAATQAFIGAFRDYPTTHPTRTLARGLDTLERYERSHVAEDRTTRAHVTYEIPFTCLLGSVLLPTDPTPWRIYICGVLDRLDQLHSGTWWLGDYKTTGRSTEVQLTSLAHENQFRAYVWAANELGTPVTSLNCDLIVLNPRNTEIHRLPITFARQDIHRWREDTLHTATLILSCYTANIWPRQGRYACTTYSSLCDYWHLCTCPPDLTDKTRAMFYQSRPTHIPEEDAE